MKKEYTPIIKSNFDIGNNNLFIKRDDLLPFSFGGNKVRIAEEFLNDMGNANWLIGYGNVRSNLCRILTNLCASKKIKCTIISPMQEDEKNMYTFNSMLVREFGAEVVVCQKNNVSEAVKNVICEVSQKGYIPYYIYGNEFGEGREAVPVRAYAKAYDEILAQEEALGIKFDYIFLPTGTGMTQAGLIAGNIKNCKRRNIVGISISRNRKTQTEYLTRYLERYFESEKIQYNDELLKKEIEVDDNSLCGGYGVYNSDVSDVIKRVLKVDGMPLDTTYTGKAFYGMNQYIQQNRISGKNILFLHTGGTPLFFDYLKNIAVLD